jgi:hypothetical protein
MVTKLTLAEVVEIEKHRIKKMFPPGTLDLVSIVPDLETGLVVVVFRAAGPANNRAQACQPYATDQRL